MIDDPARRRNPDLELIEVLIDERVRVDCNVILIDEHTWAIHGTIAVDGNVILAEFDSQDEAEAALERIAAAGDEASP